jgi:hypothetical protein
MFSKYSSILNLLVELKYLYKERASSTFPFLSLATALSMISMAFGMDSSEGICSISRNGWLKKPSKSIRLEGSRCKH